MNIIRQDMASAKGEARGDKAQIADERVVVPFASRRKPTLPIQDEEDLDPPTAA